MINPNPVDYRVSAKEPDEGLDELDPDEVCCGLICPRCRKAMMQYNGLLELTCPKCGYRSPGGAFT